MIPPLWPLKERVGFQEVLGLAVKMPRRLRKQPLPTWWEQKCLSPRGAVQNRKTRREELALKLHITN
jgi:hypothetical protein